MCGPHDYDPNEFGGRDPLEYVRWVLPRLLKKRETARTHDDIYDIRQSKGIYLYWTTKWLKEAARE